MKPRNMKLTKCCPYCNGVGHVEVSPVYKETWFLLKKFGPISGAELSRHDGCKETAMNNRLAVLEELGLARSQTYGRLRLFEAIDQ